MSRRVVVGFSGGVTSAWCAGWALRTYPADEVILLWHDTKEEHPDTYRFLREMADAMEMPITERSDGRSVEELMREEHFVCSSQNAMCSRILKREQGDRYIKDLQLGGHDVVKILGFSKTEESRIQRAWALADANDYSVRFPLVETGTTKQECADWCNCVMGVKPSAMYEWSDHANCIGCVKGGLAYWLKVAENHPDVFEKRASLEEELGATILRDPISKKLLPLRSLLKRGISRNVKRREQIIIGPCECGD